jgi:polyhydroxybutyrate depolymerase
LHGYSDSAEAVMADGPLRTTLSEAGVILIAPQGAKDARGVHTWSFPGGQSLPRNDVDFVAAVVKDAESRWPIDKKRLLASGFSVGGSMTWYVACATQGVFAAYAPVAGAFWVPEPERCKSGPVSLRHVHGLTDQTVPMQGRILRGGAMRQGDVMKSFNILKSENACSDTPTRIESKDALTCETWAAADCASARELVLCLHTGEHIIEASWILDAMRWLDRLAVK